MSKTDRKSKLIGELTELKEKERLERVKENSKLKKSIIYVDKNNPQSKRIVGILEEEGIPFEKYEISENEERWNKVIGLTNNRGIPTIEISENFLINQRDFTQPKQLLTLIKYLASPKYKIPPFEHRVIEILKNMQFSINRSLGNLNRQIMPITKIMNELAKEEKEESEKKNN